MPQKNDPTTPALSQADIVQGLRDLGLKTGDVVLVHSAMRTFGRIDGGADTVVAALLEVLGPTGTLVVPTFTFQHAIREPDPVIDPSRDPSEMGAITEAVRLRPDALRSTTFRHSFAAVGRRAREITEVDLELSPFDVRSSFGVLVALNAQAILLGVTYESSTSYHFAEALFEVPYRLMVPIDVRLRKPDGSIERQRMIDYQPKPAADGSWYGTRNPDFNCLGRMLERNGFVSTAAIGNAAVRRFAMRDMIDLALVEAAKDYDVFRTDEGKTDYFTPLDFGKVVLGPWIRDAKGTPIIRHQWCVMDEKKLVMPESS